MLLPGGMKAIAEAIVRNKDLVLFSHEAIRELIRVLAYPRILKFIPPERSGAFLASLDTFGEKVTVLSEVQVCRDPNDDHLLALCRDGDADLLITGDQDLLVIGSFGKTMIIEPAKYLSDPAPWLFR